MIAGLPSRYRDSVRAIQPGLPLFLYNYSTHQLHGVFEVSFFEFPKYENIVLWIFPLLQATSFGGTNIDPSAWEDKKTPGESRFPAQVLFFFSFSAEIFSCLGYFSFCFHSLHFAFCRLGQELEDVTEL